MIVITYKVVGKDHDVTHVYDYNITNLVTVLNSFVNDFIIPASRKGESVVIIGIDIRDK